MKSPDLKSKFKPFVIYGICLFICKNSIAARVEIDENGTITANIAENTENLYFVDGMHHYTIHSDSNDFHSAGVQQDDTFSLSAPHHSSHQLNSIHLHLDNPIAPLNSENTDEEEHGTLNPTPQNLSPRSRRHFSELGRLADYYCKQEHYQKTLGYRVQEVLTPESSRQSLIQAAAQASAQNPVQTPAEMNSNSDQTTMSLLPGPLTRQTGEHKPVDAGWHHHSAVVQRRIFVSLVCEGHVNDHNGLLVNQIISSELKNDLHHVGLYLALFQSQNRSTVSAENLLSSFARSITSQKSKIIRYQGSVTPNHVRADITTLPSSTSFQ